jgi:hypothetical protein
MKFTKKELELLAEAIDFALDNGLADDHEDHKALFELSDRLAERDL